MILTIILIVLAVIIVIKGAFVVSQQTAAVVERFGKFNRVSMAGFHVRIPFVERVVCRVDLRTNQSNFEINAKTRDNVTVRMIIAAQYAVDTATTGAHRYEGIYRSFYALSQPVVQMNAYLTDALRSSVPSYTLDEVFEKKDDIAQDVNAQVAQRMVEYGYNLISTLITNIELPADVETSMNSINAARREKEAAQALAEAEKIKVVTEATAQAEAAKQAGIGIAEQRKAIAEGISDSLDVIKQAGVSEDEANLLFMFTQWTDMMGEFAKNGKAATVVLPSDFSESRGMFEQMLVADKSKAK